MRIKRNQLSRGGRAPVWIFVSLAALCLVSLGVAGLWQYLENQGALIFLGSTVDTPIQEDTETREQPQDLETIQTAELEEVVSVPPRPQFPGAVQESTPVESSYFDDAIFFGDSISTGIPLYRVMPNAQVVAYTGVNLRTILEDKVVDIDEAERATLLEAARQYGDKGKVYILLGGNNLYLDKELFIQAYREFVLAVREQYPKAVIYLQSMTPVTESDKCKEMYPDVTNEKLEEYNQAIYQLSSELGVYFVDTAAALMDSGGKLPDTASPVDGMHFSAEYYRKWFGYLKTHTAAGGKT